MTYRVIYRGDYTPDGKPGPWYLSSKTFYRHLDALEYAKTVCISRDPRVFKEVTRIKEITVGVPPCE